jgi:hypothetical protein
MISSLTEPRAARLGSGGTARALSKCPGKSSDHPMIGRLIPGPTGWDRPFVKSEKGAEVQPVIQGPDNNLSFWQEWQDFRLEFPSPPGEAQAKSHYSSCSGKDRQLLAYSGFLFCRLVFSFSNKVLMLRRTSFLWSTLISNPAS